MFNTKDDLRRILQLINVYIFDLWLLFDLSEDSLDQGVEYREYFIHIFENEAV